MGSIKRGSIEITDLKNGSTQINKVYRATTLIWQKGSPFVPTNNNDYNTTLSFNILTPTETKYSTTLNLYI